MRSLGTETIAAVERALKAGVGYARSHPDEAARYIGEHAQEMSQDVCAAHIGLYVNDFSADLGDEGVQAVTCLLQRAEQAEIIPSSTTPIFIL